MDALHTVVLALVQGLTEFLPISSSAHLVLVPYVTGRPDQGLAYDVAAHLGTLLAVTGYYRRHLLVMGLEWSRSLAGEPATDASRLAWMVLWGTVPVGLAGLALHGAAESYLRDPRVIAATTIGFGALLWYADARGRRRRDVESIDLRDALLVGLAQALALVPGTSRSGITITAALLLGLNRQAAARYSFLLSIPVIVLAGAMEVWAVMDSGVPVRWGGLFLVTVLSCASAYLCIFAFLRVLDRIGMAPFALYRFALGAVLLALYL